jgi:hypothetical protein
MKKGAWLKKELTVMPKVIHSLLFLSYPGSLGDNLLLPPSRQLFMGLLTVLDFEKLLCLCPHPSEMYHNKKTASNSLEQGLSRREGGLGSSYKGAQGAELRKHMKNMSREGVLLRKASHK